MKKVMVSVLMMAAAAGAFAEGDAAAGKDKSTACAACHGSDGNSSIGTFPKLAGQHAKYTLKQLTDMTMPMEKGGRVVVEMGPALQGLTEQDMADLAAFYETKVIQGGATDPELLELGEQVYRAGNKDKNMAACTGCHGPAGKGNNGAAYPSLAGQHADYIEKQLKAFRLGADEPESLGARVNDGETRMMRDIASRMSDKEIRAVASFIAGLR